MCCRSKHKTTGSKTQLLAFSCCFCGTAARRLSYSILPAQYKFDLSLLWYILDTILRNMLRNCSFLREVPWKFEGEVWSHFSFLEIIFKIGKSIYTLINYVDEIIKYHLGSGISPASLSFLLSRLYLTLLQAAWEARSVKDQHRWKNLVTIIWS